MFHAVDKLCISLHEKITRQTFVATSTKQKFNGDRFSRTCSQ